MTITIGATYPPRSEKLGIAAKKGITVHSIDADGLDVTRHHSSGDERGVIQKSTLQAYYDTNNPITNEQETNVNTTIFNLTRTVMEPVLIEHKFAVGDDVWSKNTNALHFTVKAIALPPGQDRLEDAVYVPTYNDLDADGRGHGKYIRLIDAVDSYEVRPPKPEGFEVGTVLVSPYGMNRTVKGPVEWGDDGSTTCWGQRVTDLNGDNSFHVDSHYLADHTIYVEPEPTTAELRQRLLQRLIEVGPETFDMTTWGRNDGSNLWLDAIASPTCKFDATECGTAACLAGHAAVMLRGKVQGSSHDAVLTELRELLDLDPYEVGGDPFAARAHNWPPVMRAAFRAAQRQNEKNVAEWIAAVAYLTYLVETDAE
jgi:hypothetical protein